MKILNPYRFYRGGKGEADTPALMPPRKQDLRRSISISESVDVLCEGPIYGLVDKFGKKVYGLDMLKGIYLNKTPVMNAYGEYNFRNVMMEINLGTENQKPLANFKNVYIMKPAGFKLLGPINNQLTPDGSIDVRYSNGEKGVEDRRNFSQWAVGWPTQSQDPFVFVHQIRNKDVKKVRVSMLIEALFDTVDIGRGGKGEDIGLSKSTTVRLLVKTGIDGAAPFSIKEYPITGTAQAPFALTLGEPFAPTFGGPYNYRSLGGGGAGGLITRSPTGGSFTSFRDYFSSIMFDDRLTTTNQVSS
jgi:hypothetical protein